ncbi:cytochrome P450 [soil metagenome]
MDLTEAAALIANSQTYRDESRADEIFAKFRREAPVYWAEPEGYRPFWLVTRHADVMEVERQADLFVNAPRTALRTNEQEEDIKKITGTYQAARTLLQMDEPDHRKFRRLTQEWFLPKRVKTLESTMSEIANEYIDKMEQMGGSCDFVKDVALWYPLRAVMTILGVPKEDEPFMLKVTQQHFSGTDPDIKKEVGGTSGSAVADIHSYFNALVEQRRKDPRDDVVSLLMDAQIDGEPISEFDRNSYFFIMALAGHDTTSTSTAVMLRALLDNPGAYDRLRANRELLPTAIDEAIRWASPAKHFFRTATKDYELRGKKIKAGDALMLSYQSANRDEDAFDKPYEFRVDRKPNPHLAFGYGPHLCLGMHLAKLEMRSFYSIFLDRVAEIELAGQPESVQSNFVAGLKTLPVRYRMHEVELA